jgi:hypothetical protein
VVPAAERARGAAAKVPRRAKRRATRRATPRGRGDCVPTCFGFQGGGLMAAVGQPVQTFWKDTTIAPDPSRVGVSSAARAHGVAPSVRIRLPLSATSNSGR